MWFLRYCDLNYLRQISDADLYTMTKYLFLFLISAIAVDSEQCRSSAGRSGNVNQSSQDLSNYSRAYFASGCFWCVEAIFESVEGVAEAVSGYTGGDSENPTYEQVSAGVTSHAEAVEIYYDSSAINYPTLLKVFFGSHDPTTLNRQGPDSGTQYRSAIFYQNGEEKELAEKTIADLTASKTYSDPITTEVSPLTIFYKAEEYHQDYERKNPSNPYVRAVSIPRLKRFQTAYPELLKKAASH